MPLFHQHQHWVAQANGSLEMGSHSFHIRTKTMKAVVAVGRDGVEDLKILVVNDHLGCKKWMQ